MGAKPDPYALTQRRTGAKTFNFPSEQNKDKNKLLKGSEIEGEVVHREVTQQTDPDKNNEPMFWPDGSERWQLVITLQTTMREDGDDDGKRRIFGKYKMLDAITEAVQAAQERDSSVPGIEVGGYLKVVHDDIVPPDNKVRSATKLYSAHYTSLADRVASGHAKPSETPSAGPVEEAKTSEEPALSADDQAKAAAALASITDPALRAKIGLPPL